MNNIDLIKKITDKFCNVKDLTYEEILAIAINGYSITIIYTPIFFLYEKTGEVSLKCVDNKHARIERIESND